MAPPAGESTSSRPPSTGDADGARATQPDAAAPTGGPSAPAPQPELEPVSRTEGDEEGGEGGEGGCPICQFIEAGECGGAHKAWTACRRQADAHRAVRGGATRCGTVRHGAAMLCDAVLCCAVLCGAVRHGAARCGTAWTACRNEAKAAGKDYIEECQEHFKAFLQCALEHRGYYEPFLEMLGGLPPGEGEEGEEEGGATEGATEGAKEGAAQETEGGAGEGAGAAAAGEGRG
ncbi:hypothetical protein TSOC_009330 [Tetrabaena socialis]|uniref:GCK domain-containing protein n=1 Tax=Tetrabaena socialis TaxID=47790 RepID=A0A2J7ZW57_9CHLO|nr:hypothetical protein TSOC_009330 [Tetrabaena socialis]|eukprot:PNH04503.1 hypothetical protein TSOC_009330 [Tetrabaena socialis]